MSAAEWKPGVGELVMHKPHHPLFAAPTWPCRVNSVLDAGGERPCYWVGPIGPVQVRTLRTGRQIEERPNYDIVCGLETLRPCTPEELSVAQA